MLLFRNYERFSNPFFSFKKKCLVGVQEIRREGRDQGGGEQGGGGVKLILTVTRYEQILSKSGFP